MGVNNGWTWHCQPSRWSGGGGDRSGPGQEGARSSFLRFFGWSPLSTHGNWEGHAERSMCPESFKRGSNKPPQGQTWSTGLKEWVEVEGCTDELTDGWLDGCVRRHCSLVPLLLCTYPPSSVMLVFLTSTSLSTLSYWRDLPQPFFLVPPNHSTFLLCFIFFLITT